MTKKLRIKKEIQMKTVRKKSEIKNKSKMNKKKIKVQRKKILIFKLIHRDTIMKLVNTPKPQNPMCFK